jgi:hypothetical protein
MTIRFYPYSIFWLFVYIVTLFSAPREYNVNLYKDNLSWNWQGRFFWDSGPYARLRFFMTDQFVSNLYVESAFGKRWRDENNLDTYWSYALSEKFSASTHFKSQIFSDENSFVKFSKHLLFEELKLKPQNRITISPALGWTTEDIYNYRDHGFYSQLKMEVSNYDLGDYRNNTNGFSSLFIFPGRRNQEHRYFVSFSRQFSTQAEDSLQVGYEFVDNRYPLPPTVNEAQKILEDVGINSRYLYNNLNYFLSEHSVIQLETKLQNRDLTQSNKNLQNHRQELNFANRIGIRHGGPRFKGTFSFSTSQISTLSSRRPAGSEESRTDIDGLQSAFNLLMDWQVSQADNFQFSFSYTKYEYDSPDTTQTVDEDDIRFIGDLQYLHRFSDYFALKLSAHVYLYHQIYIHQSRSANNNWNRIYQLASTFYHKINDSFENRSQIKILANYTVYDFEEILPEVRSYIFRKLSLADTLSWRISEHLRIRAIYQLENEDNGTFFQDIFAQQISRELRSHLIDLGLIYFRYRAFELGTGLNWYLRKEWSHFPEKRMTRDYVAFSPSLSFVYNLGENLNIFATFSPRQYRDIYSRTQYFSTGRLHLRYFF